MSGIIVWALILVAWAGVGVFLARFVTSRWDAVDVQWRDFCDFQGCGQRSATAMDMGLVDGVFVLYVCRRHAAEVRRTAIHVVEDGDVG